jgi:ABC-type nitrate/sulfonate/bicarbonate transport system substrate-binding protein
MAVEIALRKGFFQRENIHPERIFIRSADVIVKTLLLGEVDYATVFSSAVAAAARGVPVKVVGAMTRGMDYALVSKPGIKKPDELRGKVFAISSFGAAGDYVIYTVLEKHGIIPERDAKFITVGGSSSRLAVVASGAADVTSLVAPFHYQAEKLGLRTFMTPEETSKWVELPGGGLAVAESKIRRNPDEVMKVLRAVQRGSRFIRENSEETVAIGMNWLRIDRDTGEKLYKILRELSVDDLIVPDRLVTNAVHLSVFRQREKLDVGLDKIRDWSFAERAKR